MKITDLSAAAPPESTAVEAVLRVDPLTGIPRPEERTILQETLLSVYLNGALALKMVCTPTELPALVVGHLFTEGYLSSASDVRSVYVCAQGVRARVLTNRPVRRAKAPLEIRSCNCGKNGVLGRPAAERCAAGEPLREDVCWEPRWIYELSRAFQAGAPLYRATHGIHSCLLMKDGELLYFCEDIGRHNALDKAVGRALIDGVDLTQCVLFSSGRIPEDMMQKVLRAGVPVLASNAVPTARAVALARQSHTVLICTARPDSMDVFSDKYLW